MRVTRALSRPLALLIAAASFVACDGGDTPPVDAPTAEVCDNATDDDGDGAVDCEDSDCGAAAGCAPATAEDCAVEGDEDADGAADCADTDCAAAAACATGSPEDCATEGDEDGDGAADCADTDCAEDSLCLSAEACEGGLDEDRDGQIDCADLDCETDLGCLAALPEDCSNGRDDDGDEALDCADPDCNGASACAVTDERVCDDGVDDDGDGAVDCADSDCRRPGVCGLTTEMCNDGTDNDGDGQVDCADADCPAFLPACRPAREVACANAEDDDADGATDCADSDCEAACEGGPEDCDDGADNDADGKTDCDDLDCRRAQNCASGSVEAARRAPETCTNGVDDNGDGLADCEDAMCVDTLACRPRTAEDCDNGLDDDGDGRIDCGDLNCRLNLACAGEDCDDAADNDGDGAVDCADIDSCLGDAACPVQAVSNANCPASPDEAFCLAGLEDATVGTAPPPAGGTSGALAKVLKGSLYCPTAQSACATLLSERLAAAAASLPEVQTWVDAYALTPAGASATAATPRFFDAGFLDATLAPVTTRQQEASFDASVEERLANSRETRWESAPAMSSCAEFTYQLHHDYHRYLAAERSRSPLDWAVWAADPANAGTDGAIVARLAAGSALRALTSDNAWPGIQPAEVPFSRLGVGSGYPGSEAWRNHYHALQTAELSMLAARSPTLERRLKAGREVKFADSWARLQTVTMAMAAFDPTLMTVHALRRRRFQDLLSERRTLRAAVAPSCPGFAYPGDGTCSAMWETRLASTLAALTAIDARLVEALTWAADNGCLAPPSPGAGPGSLGGFLRVWPATACDWAPSDVHAALRSSLEPLVRRDLARCDQSEDGLAAVQSGTLSYLDCSGGTLTGPRTVGAAQARNELLLAQVFNTMDEARARALACTLEDVLALDPERRPRLNQVASDLEVRGSASTVRVRRDILFDLGVTPPSGVDVSANPHQMDPHAAGIFELAADVFGVNLPIVTFEAQLSVSRDLHFADFELFGQADLIVLTAGEDRGAGSWDGSPKWEFANPVEEVDKDHGVEKGANLSILGVPVTVFAGVSGAFGCRVDFDATSGPATISPSMGFPATTLSAGLTPHLRIRAYGGGGFGWTGVSVGLRGTVTLLEAELPVTGSVAYTGGKTGNLAIGTKAVVNVHTLEGRLEAYAEAFGLDYSVVLDRWPGYGWSKTLFDASASWPLGDWAAVCAATDCE